MITFTVTGTPKAQGSKILQTAGGKTWLREADATLPGWRDNIRAKAREAMKLSLLAPGTILDTAVAVEIVFYFKRPKSVSKNRAFPHVKPDIDKLARAVLDSMTGVVYTDDGRVVDLAVRKAYAHVEGVEGATITVTPYDNSLVTTSAVHGTLARNLGN